MDLTIGTFNLNNLFSRFNFKGEIQKLHKNEEGVSSEIHYEFKPGDFYKERTYKGVLVKGKDPVNT